MIVLYRQNALAVARQTKTKEVSYNKTSSVRPVLPTRAAFLYNFFEKNVTFGLILESRNPAATMVAYPLLCPVAEKLLH